MQKGCQDPKGLSSIQKDCQGSKKIFKDQKGLSRIKKDCQESKCVDKDPKRSSTNFE